MFKDRIGIARHDTLKPDVVACTFTNDAGSIDLYFRSEETCDNGLILAAIKKSPSDPVENLHRIMELDAETKYTVIPLADIVGGSRDLFDPYVVTNTDNRFGSVSLITREDLFYELSLKLDDDLWIIPSSIHELICIPVNKSGIDLTDLISTIGEINEELVSESEQLLDNPILFKKGQTNAIFTLQD
jgi:hypothetical protein